MHKTKYSFDKYVGTFVLRRGGCSPKNFNQVKTRYYQATERGWCLITTDDISLYYENR